MIARGILFSGPMARANWAGKKSQTRRAITNANAARMRRFLGEGRRIFLWQRESFRLESNFDPMNPGAIQALSYNHMPVWFEADAGAPSPRSRSEWGHLFGLLRPGIHMPKWASRMAMELVSISEERLGDISDEDALAEGLDKLTIRGETRYGLLGRYDAPSESADGWEWDDWQASPREAYFRLYGLVNKSAPDMDAPVFALRYAVSERNILEIEKQHSGGAGKKAAA